MGITINSHDIGHTPSNLPDHVYDTRENAGKAAAQYAKSQTVRLDGLLQRPALARNRFHSMLERQSGSEASGSSQPAALTSQTTSPVPEGSEEHSEEQLDVRSYVMSRLAHKEKKRGWNISQSPGTIDFVIGWAENLTAVQPRRSKTVGDPLDGKVRKDYAMAVLSYLQNAKNNGKDISPESLKKPNHDWDLGSATAREKQRVAKFRTYCMLGK